MYLLSSFVLSYYAKPAYHLSRYDGLLKNTRLSPIRGFEMVFLLFLGSVAVIEWILGREERARHDPPSQADPKETNTADLLALAREVDCGKQTTPVRQDAISEVISTPPLSAADLKRNV